MSRIIFVTVGILVLSNYPIRPALGQVSQLLGNPEINAAAQAIRSRNTIVVSKTVYTATTIWEAHYCYYGLFGRRVRTYYIERTVREAHTVEETRDNLDDGVGWNDLSDPHLGFFENTYKVKMLPAAAGGRGTKINRAAENVLREGNGIDSEFLQLDRVLVRTPRVLSVPTAARELVRVEASIRGADDESAVINVKVQQRDAVGNLSNDRPRLDARAKKLWTDIESELNK